MTVETLLEALKCKWGDLPPADQLALMDLINKEFTILARSIEENFTAMLREIDAPLEVRAEIYLSVTDNTRDPRLAGNGP